MNALQKKIASKFTYKRCPAYTALAVWTIIGVLGVCSLVVVPIIQYGSIITTEPVTYNGITLMKFMVDYVKYLINNSDPRYLINSSFKEILSELAAFQEGSTSDPATLGGVLFFFGICLTFIFIFGLVEIIFVIALLAKGKTEVPSLPYKIFGAMLAFAILYSCVGIAARLIINENLDDYLESCNITMKLWYLTPIIFVTTLIVLIVTKSIYRGKIIKNFPINSMKELKPYLDNPYYLLTSPVFSERFSPMKDQIYQYCVDNGISTDPNVIFGMVGGIPVPPVIQTPPVQTPAVQTPVAQTPTDTNPQSNEKVETKTPDVSQSQPLEIKDHEFSKNLELKDYTIKDGTTIIGLGGFSNCVNLTHVVIPKSVQIIRPNAFFNCISLSKIEYLGTKEEFKKIDKGVYWNEKCKTQTIICSDGLLKLTNN